MSLQFHLQQESAPQNATVFALSRAASGVRRAEPIRDRIGTVKRNWIILFALGGSLVVHAMVLMVPAALHWRLFAVDLPEDAWRHEDQITIVLEPPEPVKQND